MMIDDDSAATLTSESGRSPSRILLYSAVRSYTSSLRANSFSTSYKNRPDTPMQCSVVR